MIQRLDSKVGSLRATDRVYGILKEMAITYKFRPGDRINEVDLARSLNVSRTPLREALNRLASEGFLQNLPNKGYFAAKLDPKEIFDLYELRVCLEQSAVRLACRRATRDEIDEIRKFVRQHQDGTLSAKDLLAADESFHHRVAELSKNKKLVDAIDTVAARIHFFRWVDLNAHQQGQEMHIQVLDLIEAGNEANAAALIEKNIQRRKEQITTMMRAAAAEIYLGNSVEI